MEFLMVSLITMLCLFLGWFITCMAASPTNTKAGWIGMAVGAVVGLIVGMALASTGVFTV